MTTPCHLCNRTGATNEIHHDMSPWLTRYCCDACLPEPTPAPAPAPVARTRPAARPSAPQRTPDPLPLHRHRDAALWGEREIESWYSEWERDNLIDDLQAEGAKR